MTERRKFKKGDKTKVVDPESVWYGSEVEIYKLSSDGYIAWVNSGGKKKEIHVRDKDLKGV